MSASERLAVWLRLTGLPPPECRGFVPRDQREPRLAVRELYRLRKKARRPEPAGPADPDKLRGFMPPWSLPDPSWRHNNNPWQDNAIRAWEDAG
jgi:hypothetical protein